MNNITKDQIDRLDTGEALTLMLEKIIEIIDEISEIKRIVNRLNSENGLRRKMSI